MDSSLDYWERYYSFQKAHPPSQFSVFVVNEISELDVAMIIDLGAGDLRDSRLFSNLGFNVLSIDQADINQNNHEQENIKFLRGDLLNEHTWNMIAKHLKNETTLFYSRFVFHCFPTLECEQFTRNIISLMKPGDLLAAEYRTPEDQKLKKVTPPHNRYFHNNEFIDGLLSELTKLYEFQSQGLAKYREDDAHVRRILLKR